MIVVKIGGCNGSGKTSLVRAIIEDNKLEPILNGKKIEAYHGAALGRIPVVVLGSYKNTCGGMDTISDKFDRLALIEKYLTFDSGMLCPRRTGILIFEGLITGKTYGRIGAISDRLDQKGNWLYTFMDTPFNVCVHRVLQRRKAAGNDGAFDPNRTMAPTFKSCTSVAKKAEAFGHEVIMVDHKLAASKAAANLLKQVINYKGL